MIANSIMLTWQLKQAIIKMKNKKNNNLCGKTLATADGAVGTADGAVGHQTTYYFIMCEETKIIENNIMTNISLYFPIPFLF